MFLKWRERKNNHLDTKRASWDKWRKQYKKVVFDNARKIIFAETW
jgi:hypothetical protein